VRVLCFDEFHVTDVADAMILGRLFRAIFERGVVVAATSNWPPDRLYEGGLQRDRFLPFIELLKTRMEVVHLDSAVDYRLSSPEDGEADGMGAYLYPLNFANEQKFKNMFADLTNHQPPTPIKLTVKGRTIEAEAVDGAGWFTFAQLCERPHGAEDYLKIAGEFHTVFLEGVPKLGYDRRNEAKRLMTLIDALYEAVARLYITADASPDELYRGRDHGFEFQRTVSRLREMCAIS